MRVAASSDWRDGLAFDTPVIVADVVPGEPTRCSVCGGDSAPRDRSDLWAVKHRHPHNHDGYVRFYCRTHLPSTTRSEPRADRTPVRGERRPAARRSTASDERLRAMCPDCFVEISATGVCGVCGRPAD